MKKFNTKAVVLKNLVYKDTDRIYTFLSRDRGKISGIAKGVRKVSSRRSGNLDTLNLVEVQLSEHVSGQNYITEVKTLKPFKKLKAKLSLSKRGFYIAEIVDKFLREDEEVQPIFKLLVSTLEDLEKSNGQTILKVNKFEFKLMQLLGYQPPKNLIMSWKEKVDERKYEQADKLIKNFVSEILQEDIKSLEMD